MNILPAAPSYAMTMMSFPELPESTHRWVDDQLNNAMDNMTETGRTFLTRAKDRVSHLANGALSRSVRKMAQTIGGLFHPNTIYAIADINMLQSAKPLMQRYIMAEPTLRGIFHRQLCDGYSATYVDDAPGKIGHDHYEYRRVMDGWAVIPEDQPETFEITEYYEELAQPEDDLTIDQQLNIQSTWGAVRNAVEKMIDPSCIFNSDLGYYKK